MSHTESAASATPAGRPSAGAAPTRDEPGAPTASSLRPGPQIDDAELLPQESHRFPLQDFLGFRIGHGDRCGVCEVELDGRHHNPNGTAHGAIPFALMDTAMGAAVMSVVPDGGMCATIEMQTRFHAAAFGGTLRAEAIITSAGKRIAHAEAKTWGDGGKLIASATASFAVIAQTS